MMAYRLKPGVSATKTIMQVVYSGVTVIDCSAAMGLAFNLALLLKFRDQYGEEAGNARFDYIFG